MHLLFLPTEIKSFPTTDSTFEYYANPFEYSKTVCLQTCPYNEGFLGLCLKAVISLASTQVRKKYTNDLCEGFFCSRVFFRVFDLCDFVFFSPECADARKFAIK